MSFPKLLMLIALVLFGAIGIAALVKGSSKDKIEKSIVNLPIEIPLEKVVVVAPSDPSPIVTKTQNASIPTITKSVEKKMTSTLPDANRIEELFNKNDPKLPIVETIIYKSRVAWQKGRPAWLSDYASYYATSRHFIARSLNDKPDYLKQDIAEGDRFNVLKKDKEIEFYLLIDLSRNKLWFYAVDVGAKEMTLLKTYNVGLGRLAPDKTSGYLTPIGKYKLGNRVAIYKPKMFGTHNGEKKEMIRVFGTRWIPFEKEISDCSAPAKGFGIHGLPWALNEKGELIENKNSIGKYESDGCVRVASEDIEEIFAITITKPTTIELVKDFSNAKLPYVSQK